ncbi:MAG TPA: hypothetical protein VE153_23810 [Myxococcus sp.]|nr:hypothetical protein [Myxococcus sp.]
MKKLLTIVALSLLSIPAFAAEQDSCQKQEPQAVQVEAKQEAASEASKQATAPDYSVEQEPTAERCEPRECTYSSDCGTGYRCYYFCCVPR